MEPIVSPWLIYVIEMLGSLRILMGVLAFLGFVSFIFMFPAATFEFSDVTEEDRQFYRRKLWIPTTVLLTSIVIAVLLPSREAAYKMLMASYVTPNNIHTVGKEANEAVGVLLDNITNHMKELKDNK